MERYLDACAILALRVSSILNYGMQDSFLQITSGLIRNLVGGYSALLVVKCHGNSRIIRRILLIRRGLGGGGGGRQDPHPNLGDLRA